MESYFHCNLYFNNPNNEQSGKTDAKSDMQSYECNNIIAEIQ